MKILLIQPKIKKRPVDTDLKVRMSPSLALLTLLNLTDKKHEVILVNENIEKINYNLDVDLVAMSITLDILNSGSDIAKKFMDKGIPVIAGGIHITCDYENCQNLFSSICVGPAERVWNKILLDVENNQLKPLYKDYENFKGEEIISPKYDFPRNKHYFFNNVITTSKGCQNKCAFCYNSSKNCIYVKRPVEDILKDIRTINRKHIYFIDDNFISDIDYAFELLNQIKPLNIKWACAVTTDIYNHIDLLDLMSETGCESIFIGFESVNTSSLESVNKQNKVSEYEDLINKIHERGIMINVSMVFGLDGDDKNVFKNTVDWLVKLKVDTLTSHILTPYPGTKIYDKMLKDGRITDFDLSKYTTSNVVFKPLHMTEKELYEGYLKVYKEFYSFKNIYKRMPTNKRARKGYLIFNLLYRKFGKFFSALSKIIPLNFMGYVAEKIAYGK